MNVQVLVPEDAEAFAAQLELPSVRALAVVTDRRPAQGHLQVAVGLPSRQYEPFADTVRLAAKSGRLRRLPAALLIPVGIFDGYAGELRVEPRRLGLLQRHLGRPVNRHELEASDSRQKQRQQARLEARQAHLRGDFAREAQLRSAHQVWHW